MASAGPLRQPTFWPAGLVPLYPLSARLPMWNAVVAGLLLAGICAVAFRLRLRFPFLPVGWLWFVGTLVPVIGIVQVGQQSMADRYTYIPFIGIFIMITWGTAEVASTWRFRVATVVTAAVLSIAALSAVTWQQTGHWKDSQELFTHTMRYTTGNYKAHVNLGIALAAKGRMVEAVAEYGKALKIYPAYAHAHLHLAVALNRQGRVDEAISHYREALRLEPGNGVAHNNLGIALITRGEIAEAIGHFSAAVQDNLDFGDAHYNLGLALARQGNLEEAVSHYLVARRLNPADPDVRRSLDIALARLGKRSRPD
jgi:protein O-mannosyl-transferase